jgi:chromate transporter
MTDERPLREVAWVFTKLGTIAFGGPAAHVAMMRHEAVDRRSWVDEQEFVDAFAATSAIPGPGSTQLAIYLARRRAGWMGLALGGCCFIVPAMAIVLALAWIYVRYGATPSGSGILYGIAPVVIAIIVHAIVRLGRTAVETPFAAALAAGVVAGYFLGVNVLILLLGAGGAMLIVRSTRARSWFGYAIVPLPRLFLEFLKLGSIVFGSGYVLFAYLRRDLVQGLGWLTTRRLLDAIAVGQVTPGPVFTTATFIGYLLHGFAGALVATVGIFLPSFALVALLSGVIPRMRRIRALAALLDGINAAAVALMAGVSWDLARTAIRDPLTAAIAVAALVALVAVKINYAWLIAAGAVIGLVHVWAR